jgi:hypothetical protein
MRLRRIVIPSGCAECAAPRLSAHPARSAHLEMRTLLAFLCCCGHRGTLPPTITTSRTKSRHNSMRRRRIVIPSGCAESAAPWFSAHPLARLAHLEMRKLLAFLCLTPWVPPPTITSSRTSIPRCPSVASLYRVDAPKAPVLRIKRIHLACRRISKCKHYSLFYV